MPPLLEALLLLGERHLGVVSWGYSGAQGDSGTICLEIAYNFIPPVLILWKRLLMYVCWVW